MRDIHDPHTWTWMDRPASLPSPLEMVQLTCPHKDDRHCEYRVRIHRKAVDFTLKQHLAVSCPMRSDPTYAPPEDYKMGMGLA